MTRFYILLALAIAASALKVGGGASTEQQQQQVAPQPPQERSEQPQPPPADASDELQQPEAAAPGAQLKGLDDETCHDSRAAPLGLDFLRAGSPECRRCLKSCLGGKIQNAQITFMKIQAPLSLLTWYLFKNRPFSMIPLEKALGKLLRIPAAVYGGGAVAAYMSCKPICEIDCPYPGGTPPPEELPELDGVNPTDLRFLHRLYQRGGGRRGGGGGGGGFSQALSDMFRLA